MIRRASDKQDRNLAEYAHIISALALACVVFILVAGYLENRERQAEIAALVLANQQDSARAEQLALSNARQNCMAAERVAIALREVIQVTIDTRRELADPDAAVFEERYIDVIGRYLQPRQC